MRILACQIDVPQVTDAKARNSHVGHLDELISERLHTCRGADLVVLPELSTITYSEAAFKNLDDLAEGLDGPSVRTFAQIARRHAVHICFGMPRRDGDHFYISQIVLNPDGDLVGFYDKLHMAQFGASVEKPYFTRGDHLLVFQVAGVRVAPIICYDHRFPELTRTLALKHGVDVILHPVAFFRDSTFYSWHQCAITRAIENQVHLLSLNRAGKDYGASILAPPWIDETGQPLVMGNDETLELIEIDLSLTENARKRFPYRLDMLEDYASLQVTGIS